MNTNLLYLFQQIQTLKTQTQQLYHAIRKNPQDEFLRRQFQYYEKRYIQACNRAIQSLDHAENGTVALALQLRYVNDIQSWAEIAALVGDDTVEAQCKEYLEKEGYHV